MAIKKINMSRKSVPLGVIKVYGQSMYYFYSLEVVPYVVSDFKVRFSSKARITIEYF